MRHQRTIRLAPAVALAALLPLLPARAQSIRTPAEEAGFGRYSQSDEIVRFLKAVASASREAKLQVIGKTLPAKELPATDLYLCILTEEGADSPGALKRNKPTVLIVASQHGNEQSAKEAALQMIRDLALGGMKPFLRQLNVLVIPQANPYGNLVDRRQNEQNLDLNRDHVKLESPETRAIHRVFRAWMPEVTLDVHEKGDDYYRVSTGCVSNLNIHESLQRFSRDRIFPAIARRVEADGYTWHEYLISEFVGSTQAAGVPDRPQAGQPREIQMRYSTTDLNDGRNSLGIYETLSFIQECASRHDLPTLEERTRWQYSGIRGLLEAVAGDARQVLSLVRGRRARLLREAARPGPGRVVHLRMQYVRDPREPELTLKVFDREGGGGTGRPAVVTQVVKNWLPKVESRLAVPRPQGYIVPAGHPEVIRTLLDHGIRVETLTRDAPVDVERYRVRDCVPAREDYLAPERIEVEKQQTRTTARQGDFYVAVAQPAANLIPALLEPQSEYGLIRYRMYKLAPENGSFFPIVRLVKGKPPVAPYSAPGGNP